MSEALANLLNETRQFAPPAELAANANVTADAYAEAGADRLGFWATQAGRLAWAKQWDQVLDWSNPPFAKWFVGGQLNVAYNCLDRHVEAGQGDQVAIHWEGEPGDTRTITYADLHELDLPGGERADRAGRGRRRPGGDLPADDPRGGGRDAGLRPDRRHAQRGLRRLLRRRADQPDRGRQRQGGDHRRRRLPAGQAVGAEADRGRGGGATARRSSTCWWSAAPARTSPGRRQDHWWHETVETAVAGAHRAAVRRRAPAVHPLHQRHHGQARRASCTPPAAT